MLINRVSFINELKSKNHMIDHMRARTKYVKAVEKWASELRLTGRLMFMGKLILILLQGDRSNIKVLENFILNMNLLAFS